MTRLDYDEMMLTEIKNILKYSDKIQLKLWVEIQLKRIGEMKCQKV